MEVVNNIAYAGERQQPIKVSGVRPLDNFVLWVRFSTGEAKTYDFKPLFQYPAFKPLADEKLFKNAYIDYNTVVWNNGDIDISPEELYRNGTAAENNQSA